MSALIHRLQNLKQLNFLTLESVNDYFWNLLLLSSLMLATLIGLPRLL